VTGRRAWEAALTLLTLLAVAGCGALDVSDPTAIEDEDLANAAGAALLRGDALGVFYRAFGDQAYVTGLLTDEFRQITRAAGTPPIEGPDRRELPAERFGIYYTQWTPVRLAATVALAKLREYGSPA